MLGKYDCGLFLLSDCHRLVIIRHSNRPKDDVPYPFLEIKNVKMNCKICFTKNVISRILEHYIIAI